jgi:hypothetical protein
MSPLQGLSNEHSLLKVDDEVAPSAKAEEVVAFGEVYTEYNLYFAMFVTAGELELGFWTGVQYAEVVVVVDVIGGS